MNMGLVRRYCEDSQGIGGRRGLLEYGIGHEGRQHDAHRGLIGWFTVGLAIVHFSSAFVLYLFALYIYHETFMGSYRSLVYYLPWFHYPNARYYVTTLFIHAV